MLIQARVEVECRRIRHIAASVVGHDRNVVPYLVLLWPALQRIKRGTHRDVRRPCNATVRAVSIKQLRVGIVGGIARVEPDSVEPSVGRHGKGAKPVPLIGSRVVVDPNRRPEACSAIGAAREHYIRPVAVTGRPHAGQHVNIVVRRAAGAIHSEEYLTCESRGVYVSAHQAATEVNRRNLVESWCDTRVLRIGGTNAPKAASAIAAPNEQISVTGDIECSPMGGVGKAKWCLPCYAFIR